MQRCMLKNVRHAVNACMKWEKKRSVSEPFSGFKSIVGTWFQLKSPNPSQSHYIGLDDNEVKERCEGAFI